MFIRSPQLVAQPPKVVRGVRPPRLSTRAQYVDVALVIERAVSLAVLRKVSAAQALALVTRDPRFCRNPDTAQPPASLVSRIARKLEHERYLGWQAQQRHVPFRYEDIE